MLTSVTDGIAELTKERLLLCQILDSGAALRFSRGGPLHPDSSPGRSDRREDNQHGTSSGHGRAGR
jgi:hypothetical protein